jgi:hypothetical protein
MNRSYYDDNFGEWHGMDDADMRAFYCETQRVSRRKNVRVAVAWCGYVLTTATAIVALIAANRALICEQATRGAVRPASPQCRTHNRVRLLLWRR